MRRRPPSRPEPNWETPVEDSEDDAEESLEALAAQLDRLKSLHTETGQLIGRLQQDIARFGAER